MCIIFDEEGLMLLLVSPSKMKRMLDSDETYAVEIRRSNEGHTLMQSYCIIDMTREEIIQYAEHLKKLDIEAGIWYKDFEEINILEVPFEIQTQSMEPIMNEQAQAAKEAAMTHFQRHGNKYKAIGWMLLGALVGGIGVTAKAKADADKNAGVGSGV